MAVYVAVTRIYYKAKPLISHRGGDSFPRFTKKKAIAKRIGEALWGNVSFAFPKERCYGNEQRILGEGGGVADG